MNHGHQDRASQPGRNSTNDFVHQLNAALSLLERGDMQAARQRFAALAEQDRNRTASWIGLALACQGCKDHAATEAAVNEALRLEPGNLWGLVLKGDCLARSGRSPEATAFYLNASKLAPPDEHLPPPLRTAIHRAREFVNSQSAQVSHSLQETFAGQPDLPDRFRHAVEILTGKRQIYHSSPRYFHYPGLPSIEFHDRASFPWIAALEAQTANIRRELLALLETETGFRPYIESRANAPVKSQDGLLDNMDWSACYLIKNGRIQSEIADRCPMTMNAIRQLPLCDLPARAPSVLFSRLKPGAHIPPHCGLVNTRLIGHLPLVVPNGCEFRVGATTRTWKEGEAWVFDDSIEHEAWNKSSETRVILLFEIWRPEIGATEREAIRKLFHALDSLRGMPEDWEI